MFVDAEPSGKGTSETLSMEMCVIIKSSSIHCKARVNLLSSVFVKSQAIGLRGSARQARSKFGMSEFWRSKVLERVYFLDMYEGCLILDRSSKCGAPIVRDLGHTNALEDQATYFT